MSGCKKPPSYPPKGGSFNLRILFCILYGWKDENKRGISPMII